jgi:helicase MOV-10
MSALTEIGCQTQNCQKIHDIQQCSCGLVILISQYDVHFRGKRHTRTIALQAATRNAARNVRVTPQTTANPRRTDTFNPTASGEFTHCEVCDKDIPSFRWRFHLTHPEHTRARRLAATQAALNTAAQDKNGVTVSGTAGVDFGVIELGSAVGPSAAQSRVITIQKTDRNSFIRLASFRFTSLGRVQTNASR